MATSAGIEQQSPGPDQGIQQPNRPVAEETVATGSPGEPGVVGIAEKSKAGRRAPSWANTVLGRLRKFLRLALGAALVAIAALAYLVWGYNPAETLPEGFAKSNGRIEATEIDIATKLQNRIAEVNADDGDYVSAGQIVAKMDATTLSAELREAQAQHRLAKSNVEAARATIAQREKQKSAADSVVAQHEAKLRARSRHFDRIQELVPKGGAAADELDASRAEFYAEKAAIEESKAQVSAAEAAIATARSQLIEAEAAVDAAKAKCERIQADIDDSLLKAPRDGRVQYRIAQAGEVLYPGGKVLNMVDLSDVFMTFFLPDTLAGRLKVGAEVRLVLDAAPQYVIPARVTMIADVAQFTPKTVETAVERQKLTFRIKAKIDKDVLKSHLPDVKTGLPGMAYARLDSNAEWPERLQVKLPPPSSPSAPLH